MPNPLTSSQFARLLDKRMREVGEGGFKEIPTMIPTLYRTLSSDSAFEEFYNIGSLPDIPTFNGILQYLNIAPGFYTKIEPKQHAAGVAIERTLLDDKKYGVLDDIAGAMGQSAARTMEKRGVRPFAYAFSNTFDYMTSEEGVALCSSSHTTKASGVSTASGFSNAGTSALNPTSIAATRLLMRKFKNDIGERIEINPDMLLVPDNLADRAMEIVGTEKGLDTAAGNTNVQFRRFKVVPYLRLDDYDTNNWFMIDSSLMKRFLVWITRIAPEFKNDVDWSTFQILHSVYFRIGAGWLDWRWLYGHEVS